MGLHFYSFALLVSFSLIRSLTHTHFLSLSLSFLLSLTRSLSISLSLSLFLFQSLSLSLTHTHTRDYFNIALDSFKKVRVKSWKNEWKWKKSKKSSFLRFPIFYLCSLMKESDIDSDLLNLRDWNSRDDLQIFFSGEIFRRKTLDFGDKWL